MNNGLNASGQLSTHFSLLQVKYLVYGEHRKQTSIGNATLQSILLLTIKLKPENVAENSVINQQMFSSQQEMSAKVQLKVSSFRVRLKGHL